MLTLEVVSGYVHDAVLQWAYGVNRTVHQGFPPDDGFKVTKNIINMTFEGITGTVTINDVGDRKTDQRWVSIGCRTKRLFGRKLAWEHEFLLQIVV